MKDIIMEYQRITIEVPTLPDEAAAYLHKFIEALMYAVDDQYYRQIHHYYSNQLNNMMKKNQLHTSQDTVDDPPF